MEYLENKFFLLAFTFGVFFLSRVLQKKTGWVVLNPILLTIAVLILFLQFTGVSYETYSEAGSLVEFWLKPAVVALMLYFDVITAQFWPIVIATLVSTILVLVVTGWVHQLVRKYGVCASVLEREFRRGFCQ